VRRFAVAEREEVLRRYVPSPSSQPASGREAIVLVLASSVGAREGVV